MAGYMLDGALQCNVSLALGFEDSTVGMEAACEPGQAGMSNLKHVASCSTAFGSELRCKRTYIALHCDIQLPPHAGVA